MDVFPFLFAISSVSHPWSCWLEGETVEEVDVEASNYCVVLFCVCVAFLYCMYLLAPDIEPVSVGFWTSPFHYGLLPLYNAVVHLPFAAVGLPGAIGHHRCWGCPIHDITTSRGQSEPLFLFSMAVNHKVVGSIPVKADYFALFISFMKFT